MSGKTVSYMIQPRPCSAIVPLSSNHCTMNAVIRKMANMQSRDRLTALLRMLPAVLSLPTCPVVASEQHNQAYVSQLQQLFFVPHAAKRSQPAIGTRPARRRVRATTQHVLL